MEGRIDLMQVHRFEVGEASRLLGALMRWGTGDTFLKLVSNPKSRKVVS